MPRRPAPTKGLSSTVLGLKAPVTAAGPLVKVVAWRDTDKPRGARKYHVALTLKGGPSLDMFALTVSQIEALAVQFQDLHAQLAQPEEATQKLPPKVTR